MLSDAPRPPSQAPLVFLGLLVSFGLAAAGAWVLLRPASPPPSYPLPSGTSGTTREPIDPDEIIPPLSGAADASPALRSPKTHDLSGDPLPPGAVLRLGTTRLRHGGTIRALAFTPDGKGLWSGGDDKSLSHWDVATGRELHRKSNWSPVTSLAFLSDGRTLVSSGGPDATYIFRDTSGRAFLRLIGARNVNTSDSFVYPLACSPSGKRVATPGPENSIQIWDGETGEPLRSITGPELNADFLAFSDEDHLTSISRDGTLRAWDVTTGNAAETRKLSGVANTIQTFAASPDRRTVAVAEPNSIVLRESATGKETSRLACGAQALGWSADGKRLAATDGSPGVRVWDLASGKQVLEVKLQPGWLPSVALSPDGTLVAAGTREGIVRLWEVPTGRGRFPPGHTGPVRSIAFSPDGGTILTAGEDGVREWNAETGEERVGRRFEESASLVRFLPGGRVLIAGSGSFRVRERGPTGQERVMVPILTPASWSGARPAVSAGGDRLAAFESDTRNGVGVDTPDSAIGIWDLSTGKETLRIVAPPGNIESLAFSPGTRTLAAVIIDRAQREKQTLIGWDVSTGHEEFRVSIPTRFSYRFAAAYSPKGQLTLLGGSSESRSLPLGRKGTALVLYCVPAFPGQTQWSPDGTLFASTCWRDNHRVDISGAAVTSLRGPRGTVTSLAFSPDSRLLATGHSDGAVVLWDAHHAGTGEAAPRNARVPSLEQNENAPPSLYMSFDGHLRGRGVLTTRTAEATSIARFVPGKKGEAIRVENLPEARPLEFAEGESIRLGPAFTVEFWFCVEEGAPWNKGDHLQVLNSDLFSFDVRDELHPLLFYHFWNYSTGESGGHGQFSLNDPPGSIAPGRWVHVAMTYDGTGNADSLVCYRDGRRIKSTSPGSTLSDHVGPLRIGPWGRHERPAHAAALDDLAIFDYARSPDQIKADSLQAEDTEQHIIERPPAVARAPEGPEVEGAEVAEWVSLPEDVGGMIRIETRADFTVYRFDGDLTDTQTYGVALADGAVWIGTGRGLMRHALGSATWTLFGDRAGVPYPMVMDMAAMGGDLLLDLCEPTRPGCCTGRGVWRFSPSRRACDEIGAAREWDSSIIGEGEQEWVEVDGNLFAHDPSGGLPKRYAMEKSGVLQGDVSAIARAGEAVWFASYGSYVEETKGFAGGGVSRFDLATKEWRGFTERDGLARSYCSDLAADAREVWTAHWDEERGLSVFDVATEKWSAVVKSANGIEVGGPRLVLTPEAVWIGQQRGLVRLDRATREAKAWHEKDGLPGYIVSGLAVAPDAIWIAVYAYGNGGVRSAGVVRVPRK